MCVIDEPNAYIVFCFLTGRRTAVSTVEDVVKAVKGGGPHFFVDVLRLMDAADGDEEGDGEHGRRESRKPGLRRRLHANLGHGWLIDWWELIRR